MNCVGGVDIGGTKCAVSIGVVSEKGVEIIDKIKFPTPGNPEEAVEELVNNLKLLSEKYPDKRMESVGISCGSPLDSARGLILSPPHLSNWDHIDVVTPFTKAFGIPAAVQNDANACALAEWMWGAGKGTKNMIFLTFGTGLGAGLVLNGDLYAGTNDMAGEVGHIRLEEDGPVGYGKAGSFEGFCGGAGIAKLAKSLVREYRDKNMETRILTIQPEIAKLTTADVGQAASEGDGLAISIFKTVGEKLGKGISILIDVLNPERIIIGSIFLRQEKLLRDAMEAVIAREALSWNREVCKIVAAGLGEEVGDYAAFSVAMNIIRRREK
ncbi:glucokinase [Anaerotaenia torta]|uniref:ROK family protein n=1 Tax=Anaerotaenia torta TaxID=433293 RepID=UPI003D203500